MANPPNPILFSSQRLDLLVKQLYTQIEADRVDLFDSPLIIISHSNMKEWIQVECAHIAEKKGLLGWEFASWQQALPLIAGSLSIPKKNELEAAIWEFSLRSPPSEWTPFLLTDQKRLDLVATCTQLFYDYLIYGLPETFEAGWQKSVFQELLKAHAWTSLPAAIEQAFIKRTSPLYLFAPDYLPPSVYQFYLNHPHVRLFRFSPTAMFWDDVRSPRERLALLKKGKEKSASLQQLAALETLLRDQQPLLASWGILGRKMSEASADFEFTTHDLYEVAGEESLLTSLQCDLLTMEISQKEKDDSLQIIQTGASRLREVEIFRDQILSLAEQGIPFSSMRIYAPDISLYAPLLTFVFADIIPFRISGIDLARQSSAFQALQKLCHAPSGRWDAKEWLSLLETKAFTEKQGWSKEDLEQIKEWIDLAQVRWGIDQAHQNEVTAETVDAPATGLGTWERGFDRLLDLCLYFDESQEAVFNWSQGDLFEEFLSTFHKIRATIINWKKERPLKEWAEEIEHFAEEFITFDESEEDRAAKGAFSHALRSLYEAGQTVPETLFPFSFVKHHLFMPSYGEIGASLLEAVRCASLELGTILPARIIFLLGMDEESFPRSAPPSSLHLLKKSGVYLPGAADIDRYLFLQSIFAAQEKWICSYGHLSKEDGKAVSPSLLVQELMSYLKLPIVQLGKRSLISVEKEKNGSFLENPLLTKQGALPTTLSLQALRKWIRNPFQCYLEQVVGLERKEEEESKWEEFENSPLIRYLFLKDSLKEAPEVVLERLIRKEKLPLGLLGLEAQRDLLQRAKDFRIRLDEWGLPPTSLHMIEFKESCLEPTQVSEDRHERPSIQVEVFGTKVSIVGEVTLAPSSGAIYLGDDSIGGVLKAWPEILASCIGTAGTSLYSLRSGKERKMESPLLALQALTELYFLCRETPLFLHPEWADSLLRKDAPLEREAEDRVLDWVLERSPSLNLEEEQKRWKPLLDRSFASLNALFPTRKGKSSHAEV